jgi:putative heme-binding domain-containing protein
MTMIRYMVLFVILALFAMPLLAVDPPSQAARGKAIFFDAAKKTQCATCHQLGTEGTAVGPDLTKIARVAPKAFEISMLSTRTVYAKEVETKARQKFAAMIASETEKEVTLYNLNQLPPEKMVIERSAIYAIHDNGTWKHPPESMGYKKEQIADIIAFIRFVASGDTKGVDPEALK